MDLAEQVRVAGDFGLISPADAFAEGQVCVNKALQLDPLLGEAHALSAAYLAWRDFEWQRASREFDRAIELAPGSAHVRRLRASYYLVPTGRLRDAQEEMELAVASDPVSPLAYIELGKVLLWARQFERAHAKMEAAFELRPDYPLAVWYRGVGFYFQGRLEEALELWQPAWHKFGGGPGGMQASIGMALGQLGRREEARAVLVCLEAGRATQYVRPTCFAQVHMGLGETAATLQWLARAIDERDHNVLDLPCKPIWDGLRNDPRFTTLLCKMRLV